MDEEQGDVQKSWALLIPDLYYDILARVIPGAVLITMLSVLYGRRIFKVLSQEALALPDNWTIAPTLMLLGAALSYVVGILLVPMGFVISYPYRIVFRTGEDQASVDRATRSNLWSIRMGAPELARIVTKKQAEAVMTSNIFVASLIVLLVRWTTPPAEELVKLEWWVALTLIALGAAVHRAWALREDFIVMQEQRRDRGVSGAGPVS